MIDITRKPRAAEQAAISLSEARLGLVFAALADPVRRAILERLDGNPLLVSELAEPFEISLQAVSKHIQVLVKAGLVAQERTGRVSLCRIDAGPIYTAAVWLNRYSKYWQNQFDTLASWLEDIERNKRIHAGGKRAARPRRAKEKRS